MTAKNFKVGKKKKGSILPLIVVLIIGYLAYSANPEYWQQGKIFDDLKNGGFQREAEVVDEPIANIPDENAEPELDPDTSYEGSVPGAKTIPKNIRKSINSYDPLYYVVSTKFRYGYAVLPDGDNSKKLVSEINELIGADSELEKLYRIEGFYYNPSTRTKSCEETPARKFFCDVCDRKVCIVNPKKNEFIPVSASASSVIAKMKQLQNTW